MDKRVTVNDYSHSSPIEPGKRSGLPCILRMRITAYGILLCLRVAGSIWEYLAGGMINEEISPTSRTLTP